MTHRAWHSRLIMAALLIAASPAFAQATNPPAALTAAQKDEARQHYVAGARKFDMAKYDEAAQEFGAAYEIIGDPVILYNIAQSYRLAHHYDKALTFYRSYLRRAENPRNRDEVERRITEMNDVISQQKKASEAPPTGTLPSAAQKPAPQTAAPVEPTRPAATAPEATTPAPPSPVLRYIGFAAAGLAVAALAVGGAMSGLAAKASGDVESASQGSMATWSSALGSFDIF